MWDGITKDLKQAQNPIDIITIKSKIEGTGSDHQLTLKRGPLQSGSISQAIYNFRIELIGYSTR